MRDTLKLFVAAALAAAAASWATPRAQPLDARFRSLRVDDFAAAGEVRMFSVDADAGTAGAQCPAGWTPFTAAAGRFPVAVTSSGTLAGTLGTAYADTDGPVRRGGTAQRVTARPSASWSGTFNGSRVTPSASFSGNRVTPSATFTGTRVAPGATFSGSRVTPRATFTGSRVTPTATFRGTAVTPAATFRGTAEDHAHTYQQRSRSVASIDAGANYYLRSGITTSSTSRTTLTPAGTVSVSPITPAGSVSISPFTPVGTVSVSPITPAGTVTVTPLTPAGSVTVSPFTPSGSVTVSPFTPSGSVSGTVSVSAVALSTSDQAAPAPGLQLLFCIAEA